MTDDATNYIAIREMLMGKVKKLYWMPCVAYSVDLVLEDFEKNVFIHKETIPKGRKIATYVYSITLL